MIGTLLHTRDSLAHISSVEVEAAVEAAETAVVFRVQEGVEIEVFEDVLPVEGSEI